MSTVGSAASWGFSGQVRAPLRMEADVPEGFDRGSDAEGLEQSWPGCRIDTSAFVERVSGSRPGCP